MRKLLFILSVLTIVSCCPAESTETITVGTSTIKTTETIKIPSVRIDIVKTGSYFYHFTYEGHEYITNYGCDFIYHIPSCPCRNRVTSILDVDSSLETSSLFDN